MAGKMGGQGSYLIPPLMEQEQLASPSSARGGLQLSHWVVNMSWSAPSDGTVRASFAGWR